MLLSEAVRRWGLLVLGVALLIVGVIVILHDPTGTGTGTGTGAGSGSGPERYSTDESGNGIAIPMSAQTRLLVGWGMSVVGVVLTALGVVIKVRGRRNLGSESGSESV
jgi:uncharacterized membrane protein